MGGISERAKEIKRRRHRRKKLEQFGKRLKKASASEKTLIAAKLRNLTAGAEVIIDRWELRESTANPPCSLAPWEGQLAKRAG